MHPPRFREDGFTFAHTVKANPIIDFSGREYVLASSVCHLGHSARSGHYVAVVKHATPTETWYLYDDSRCVEATAEQISTECSNYNGLGTLKSYILMYTKRV